MEIRLLVSDEVRTLPLRAIKCVHLQRSKNAPKLPDEELLQLIDGDDTIEAKTLGDLAAQLRQRYPDQVYARTLHGQRDQEAERRREEALNGLAEILARSVIDDMIKRGGL